MTQRRRHRYSASGRIPLGMARCARLLFHRHLRMGFGFYGNSVYVAVLHDTRGWSLSLITGATTPYYLAGAVLLMYVHRAIEVLGPQLLLISGAVILGVATIGFTRSQAPWQRAP
jgi:hypothetical protein